jgi:hypothetical protein
MALADFDMPPKNISPKHQPLSTAMAHKLFGQLLFEDNRRIFGEEFGGCCRLITAASSLPPNRLLMSRCERREP